MILADDDPSPCGTIEFLDLPEDDEIFTVILMSGDWRWPIRCIRNGNTNDSKSCFFSVISLSISHKDPSTNLRFRNLQIRVFGLRGSPRLFDVKYFSETRKAFLDQIMSLEDAESLYERF